MTREIYSKTPLELGPAAAKHIKAVESERLERHPGKFIDFEGKKMWWQLATSCLISVLTGKEAQGAVCSRLSSDMSSL